MSEQKTLLPPLREVHARLTQNARERAILRGLARLHAQQRRWEERPDESEQASPDRQGE